MKNEHVNSEYMKRLSEILADTGFAVTILGPDGPILGTKVDMMIIDDLSALDREALKDATFGLNYHGDVPIQMVDYEALENRILAAWEFGGMHDCLPSMRTLRRAQEQRLRDFHVVQRKSTIRQKQWETKAAIKSRQLRNRQKG